MKTALAVLAVSAAYCATADELPGVPELAQEVQAAQVDPMTGKVWDANALEWVELREYTLRIQQRGTVHIEQVPFVPASIANGLHVLAEREEAVRRHWDRVFYMQGLINTPLRFR